MSALYDKVVTAIAEHAHRCEVARSEPVDPDIPTMVKRRIKLNPADWEALKAELGTESIAEKLWTPGSWLLSLDVVTDEFTMEGDVVLETTILEIMP